MAFLNSNTLKSLLTPIWLSTISGVILRLSSGNEIITLSNSDISLDKSEPICSAIIEADFGSMAVLRLLR